MIKLENFFNKIKNLANYVALGRGVIRNSFHKNSIK